MVRATKKSLKFFSYAAVLMVGAILVMFGIQAKNEGGKVASDNALNLITDEAQAAHPGGDFVGGGDDGDDDDGGGGDGGGG